MPMDFSTLLGVNIEVLKIIKPNSVAVKPSVVVNVLEKSGSLVDASKPENIRKIIPDLKHYFPFFALSFLSLVALYVGFQFEVLFQHLSSFSFCFNTISFPVFKGAMALYVLQVLLMILFVKPSYLWEIVLVPLVLVSSALLKALLLYMNTNVFTISFFLVVTLSSFIWMLLRNKYLHCSFPIVQPPNWLSYIL